MGTLEGTTVLLLVHDGSTRKAIATALERAGALVHACASYQEALPLVFLERIDAIACDVDRPGGRSGLELVEVIHGLPDELHASPRVLGLGQPWRRSDEPIDDRLDRPLVAPALVARVAALIARDQRRVA